MSVLFPKERGITLMKTFFLRHLEKKKKYKNAEIPHTFPEEIPHNSH